MELTPYFVLQCCDAYVCLSDKVLVNYCACHVTLTENFRNCRWQSTRCAQAMNLTIVLCSYFNVFQNHQCSSSKQNIFVNIVRTIVLALKLKWCSHTYSITYHTIHLYQPRYVRKCPHDMTCARSLLSSPRADMSHVTHIALGPISIVSEFKWQSDIGPLQASTMEIPRLFSWMSGCIHFHIQNQLMKIISLTMYIIWNSTQHACNFLKYVSTICVIDWF